MMLIRTSKKSRFLRLAIYPDGRVVLTKPSWVSIERAAAFAKTKSAWIEKKLAAYKNRKVVSLPGADKSRALQFVRERVEFFNQHYKHEVGKVTVKSHKTLWGSCSRRKNLNFNSRIILLTPTQADYIIVHELCHLKEFNHSKNFWKLVSETIPDYKQIKKELKSYAFY